MIEGQGSGAVGTAELPVGVRLRHAWRPPMLRTLDALLLGIEARARPLLGGVDRLVAWHAGLSRRAEPWNSWQPLELPTGVAGSRLALPPGGPFDDPSRRPATVPPSRSPDAVSSGPASAESPRVGTPGVRPTSMPGVASARPVRSTIGTPRPFQGRASGERPVPHRPGVRLASLRQPSWPPRRPPGTPPVYGSVQPIAAHAAAPSTGEAFDRPSSASFGPILSASPSPRREVRGGFPAPPTAGPTIPMPTRTDLGTPPPVVPSLRVPPSPAAEGPVPRAPLIPPAVAPSRLPGRPPDGPGLIERLIESTVLPAPLPGLELRLVPPEERVARDVGAATPSPVESAEAAPAEKGPAAPALPSPPLDLNALADRVYQTLQRRQLLERERRGLY